ncbi:MAG: thiamine-phosphate kinase [Sneathiella sp.]|nr:MAG: thiamine-phosphate kinase [Sneathiella sp.]
MTIEGDKTPLNEFDLIDRFFAPLSTVMPGAYGLTDDAATIHCQSGKELVLTKDAMVSGIHFLENDDPADIARKLLRVNLSDLAAMGAAPVGYLLATFWPIDHPVDWIRSFADGLARDQAEYGIGLLGGDTVRTPGPLSLSLTAVGEVGQGTALRRNGARHGDLIVVSGTIGDGALGLLALQGKLDAIDPAHRDWLADRYHLPTPRLSLGKCLIGKATACADISDGLVADIGHICEASAVGAVVNARKIPLSDAAIACVKQDPLLLPVILTGGDDYELAFSVPARDADIIPGLAADANITLTVVGHIEGGEGVRVLDQDGAEIPLLRPGWQHF